ncbi:MAG: hypothetical protein WCR07_11470 [Verrucomicrobiota bacterium]
MKRFYYVLALVVAGVMWMALRSKPRVAGQSGPGWTTNEPRDPAESSGWMTRHPSQRNPGAFGTSRPWRTEFHPKDLGSQQEPGDRPGGFVEGMLQGMDAMTRMSDALVEDPARTREALMAVLQADGLSEGRAREICTAYPAGSESLADVYARSALNPELQSIRAAMEGAGVRWDPARDCLLDCHRLVVGMGEVRDFVHDVQRSLAEAFSEAEVGEEVASLDREVVEAEAAFLARFRDRFVRRHDLTEAEAESLLRALAGLRAPTATVSDLYVPIRAVR